MSKPWLSVIVPCRGQLPQLRISAPPLLVDVDVEYILVDDACPDTSGKTARAYWPAAKVVNVASGAPRNLGVACNAGARAASGAWLAFLDPALVVPEGFSRDVRPLLTDDVFLEWPTPSAGPNLILCPAPAFARAGGLDARLPSWSSQADDLGRRLSVQGLRHNSLPAWWPPFLMLDDAAMANPAHLLATAWAGKFYPSWARWPNPLTLGICGDGFGDCIKSIQYAYYLERERHLEISLYPLWHGFPGVDFQKQPRASRESVVREVLAVLDVPHALKIVTDVLIDDVYVPDLWPWHFPAPITTKTRWKGWRQGRSRRIAYQFDARSHADDKDLGPGGAERLFACAPDHEWIALGKHRSVADCVEIAAGCDLFVGVDSGMMHLCYAVGVPVFLVRNRMDPLVLRKWHGDQHAIHCDDARDCSVKIRQFLALDC